MKVICPQCGKVIDTNLNKDTVFCSECGSNFSFEQGKKLFDRQFGQISKAAFVCLNQKGDYDKAIELFNECLEIKSDDLSSIIGIALATLYRQDFLNLNFDKIIPLIDQYEIYLNEENTFLFLSFMEDVIKETKRYLIEANERLFKDGKCISRIYLNNYEQSLKDIITLINYFRDAITICSEEEKNIFYQDHNMDDELNTLEDKIKSLQEIHHEVLENEESLDDNRIIVVNTKGLKTYRYAMGFEIAMAIIMIVFLLLGVFLKNNLFYYLILIPLGLGVIGYLIYYFAFLRNK